MDIPEARKASITIKHRHNITDKINKAITTVHNDEAAENCKRLVDVIVKGGDNKFRSPVAKYRHEWNEILANINEKQAEAMSAVAGDDQGKDGHKISIIKGPPGTGKTYISTHIAAQHAYAFRKEREAGKTGRKGEI